MAQQPLMSQGPFVLGFTITPRHTILSRTPLDEWSAWRRELYRKTHNTHKWRHPAFQRGSNPQSQQANLRPRGQWDWWMYKYKSIKSQIHLSGSFQFSILRETKHLLLLLSSSSSSSAIGLTSGVSRIHLHTNSSQNTQDGTHTTITRGKNSNYKEKVWK
jgi:hypothetical protein